MKGIQINVTLDQKIINALEELAKEDILFNTVRKQAKKILTNAVEKKIKEEK